MHFFKECWKNILKKHFAEKSHSVFEGPKEGPFKHNKTFILPTLFPTLIKNAFIPIQKKNHKNMQVVKKKEIIERTVFKLGALAGVIGHFSDLSFRHAITQT